MLSAGMILTKRPPTLLAADVTTLSPIGGLAVVLFNQDFIPGESEDILDYSLADFDGASALVAGATGGLVSQDPLTGDWWVLIKDPVGGWRWVVTGTTNLPQSIYGFGLTEPGPTNVYASQLFDSPIALSAVSQAITIGLVGLRFPGTYLKG